MVLARCMKRAEIRTYVPPMLRFFHLYRNGSTIVVVDVPTRTRLTSSATRDLFHDLVPSTISLRIVERGLSSSLPSYAWDSSSGTGSSWLLRSRNGSCSPS